MPTKHPVAAGGIARRDRWRHRYDRPCAEPDVCRAAAELILHRAVPAPQNPAWAKLRVVAQDCRRHVAFRAAAGGKFFPGTLAARIDRGRVSAPADAGMTITTISRSISTGRTSCSRQPTPCCRSLRSRHLRGGALVCDVSRPFNIAPDLVEQRPDLRLVSGGLVQAPKSSVLGPHRSARPRECAGGLCRRDDRTRAVGISK